MVKYQIIYLAYVLIMWRIIMVNEFVATSEGVKNVDPSLDWKGNGAICISGLPRFPQAYESLMSLKTHLENTNPNATL